MKKRKPILTGFEFFLLRKILKIMKLTTILLLTTTMLVSANVYSQSTRLTLKFANITYGELFQEIEKQSEFRFAFSNSKLDPTGKIQINATEETLEQILNEALPTGITYEIIDRYVVILNASEKTMLTERQQKQQQTVSGKVTDESGQPLPGVTIVIKGTTRGAITNTDGNYSLTNVPYGATLIFSFVGMKTQEIPVSGRTNIDVIMAVETIGLEEVVAIGYGTVKKGDLTGSVEKVNASVFKNQNMTQITDMLAGTVAGFNTTQSTGAAGGGSLEVRGRNSLNASTEPMVVLDGSIYPGSIRDINPMDVESIDILKDASSAAVFGARAASGVILITTTKGGKGKPKITFSTQAGVTQVTNKYGPYDAQGYIGFRQDVQKIYHPDNPSFYYANPEQLPEGVTLEQWRSASSNPDADDTREWLSRLNFYDIEIENYLAGKTVDWFDEVFRTGVRQKYDLSVSGGTDNLSYYWSIDYQDNEGIVLGDDYSTIRSRLNFDFNPTKWLNVGLNTQFSQRDQSTVSASVDQMRYMSPYGSLFDENGDVVWYPNSFTVYSNPLINYYGQDRDNKINSFFSTLYANIKLPAGFNYKISYQPRFQFTKDYNYWSTKTIMGTTTHPGGFGQRSESTSFGWILDNIITWKKLIGFHNFDLTLLYSSEQNRYWASTLENESFTPNELLGYSGLQFGTNPAVNSNDTESTGDAAMARLNYAWKGRYLITASIRRDGYSAFGRENPRATFPALAVAWKLSEEDFFNVDPIYQLKLRTSWGKNGNRDIGAYSALARLQSTLYYDATNVQVGVSNSSLANYGLVWEKTESLNFGMDLGLFDNRLSMTADYYIMKTQDLLMNRKLPEITGYSSITSNLGELENRGFELTINSVNIRKQNFTWRSNLVFSLNRNKIIRLFGDYEEVEINGQIVKKELPDYSNEWFPGHAIDAIWNYKTLGIWQVDEESEAAVYTLKPGDWKAEDVDDNDKFEALTDKQFIGHREPRYRVGLRNEIDFLKNFTFLLFLRAELGHLAAFADARRYGGSDNYDRRNFTEYPYWTPGNPINDFPRLDANDGPYGGGLQIFKKAAFVRAQDVSLSYTIPYSIMQRYGIENMRIYGSARNLFYISDWPGWDPESLNGPMPKTYTLGLTFTL